MSSGCGFSLRWSLRGSLWQLQPYIVPESSPSCSHRATSTAVFGPMSSVGVSGQVTGWMGRTGWWDASEVGPPVLWMEREGVPEGQTTG